MFDMKTYRFEVERIDCLSSRAFEQTIAAFEQEVPAADMPALQDLVKSRAQAAEIQPVVQTMIGSLEFTYFAKLDQGPLASLLGKRKKLTVYLLGNPVLANKMFEHRPEAGLYAPLRASIYEDHSGACHFTYDRPSTLFGQFENNEIHGVAKMLDEKMASVACKLCDEEP